LATDVEPERRRFTHRARQSVAAGLAALEPEPALGNRENLLGWRAQRLGEDRAQALVAREHVAQRRLQRGRVEPALQTQGQRDVARWRSPLATGGDTAPPVAEPPADPPRGAPRARRAVPLGPPPRASAPVLPPSAPRRGPGCGPPLPAPSAAAG